MRISWAPHVYTNQWLAGFLAHSFIVRFGRRIVPAVFDLFADANRQKRESEGARSPAISRMTDFHPERKSPGLSGRRKSGSFPLKKGGNTDSKIKGDVTTSP